MGDLGDASRTQERGQGDVNNWNLYDWVIFTTRRFCLNCVWSEQRPPATCRASAEAIGSTSVVRIELDTGIDDMTIPEPELERLFELALAGRDHPDHTFYAGLPAFNHDAVLAVLSPDRKQAKRLHREYVWLGVISPPVATSRSGKSTRVQFLYTNRIADALKVGRIAAITSSAPAIERHDAAVRDERARSVPNGRGQIVSGGDC